MSNPNLERNIIGPNEMGNKFGMKVGGKLAEGMCLLITICSMLVRVKTTCKLNKDAMWFSNLNSLSTSKAINVPLSHF